MGLISQLMEIRTDDKDLMSLQDSVKQLFQEVAPNPFLRGTLVKNVSLVSGSVNNVAHGLKEPVTGYIVTRNQANAVIWDTQGANSTPRLTYYLNTSANTTVDLWFF
jgi:hypothetical protein